MPSKPMAAAALKKLSNQHVSYVPSRDCDNVSASVTGKGVEPAPAPDRRAVLSVAALFKPEPTVHTVLPNSSAAPLLLSSSHDWFLVESHGKRYRVPSGDGSRIVEVFSNGKTEKVSMTSSERDALVSPALDRYYEETAEKEGMKIVLLQQNGQSITARITVGVFDALHEIPREGLRIRRKYLRPGEEWETIDWSVRRKAFVMMAIYELKDKKRKDRDKAKSKKKRKAKKAAGV